jgi:Pyruvate/2-oxoacid:ferredoxin oxidoreductase delta subunit
MNEQSLYQQLAECIGFGDSKMVPELFAMIADEDEARLLLAAAPPATIGEIAEKAGLPLEKAEQMVRPLFEKGLLFKSKKPGEPRYYRLRNFIQFHDGTVLTPGISREYLDKWKEFEAVEMPAYREKMLEVGMQPFMRVIPVNVTVTPGAQVMFYDDVTQMIDQAREIAVTNCSCRTIHEVPGVPREVCIQLDKAADYALDRGTGRRLSKEEAVELLKMCEEKGLVHTVLNQQDLGYMICNCDSEVCENWPDKNRPKLFTAPSRFIAEVDAETCVSCETCLERCFFDAIAMEGEEGTALVDEERCMGCGLCRVTCPEGAITMKAIRDADSIPSS